MEVQPLDAEAKAARSKAVRLTALALRGYVTVFPSGIPLRVEAVREYFAIVQSVEPASVWPLLTYAPKVFHVFPSHQEMRWIAAGQANRDHAIRRLRALEYGDYLRSPWWKFIRHVKIDDAGQNCQLCSATEGQLDVHHRTYERLGDEQLDDLTVLCRKCHSKFHDKEPGAKR